MPSPTASRTRPKAPRSPIKGIARSAHPVGYKPTLTASTPIRTPSKPYVSGHITSTRALSSHTPVVFHSRLRYIPTTASPSKRRKINSNGDWNTDVDAVEPIPQDPPSHYRFSTSLTSLLQPTTPNGSTSSTPVESQKASHKVSIPPSS
ncbi:hypothetical protein K435DRAFT_853287 [Dendrothele bispora CBS 962.96]|uniref:Uncharacterized protein n=1 Tax=Dendrothele bispora (strain CBS 962.96) TaxID=1314807 RepID=A0A4V4HH92_DENBC|nr:hypothetical protein K435DRAFT_853287 [Dendrothele bispora CBS 962.96]